MLSSSFLFSLHFYFPGRRSFPWQLSISFFLTLLGRTQLFVQNSHSKISMDCLLELHFNVCTWTSIFTTIFTCYQISNVEVLLVGQYCPKVKYNVWITAMPWGMWLLRKARQKELYLEPLHRGHILLPFRTENRTKLNVTAFYTSCFEISSEICVKSTKRICGMETGRQLDVYFLITEIVPFAYNNPSSVHTQFSNLSNQMSLQENIFISRKTSMLHGEICKYYLINSTQKDRLKALYLCS